MAVRFAPSPTGIFHLGNLRTAWISHWWAKQLRQPWVLRFEDIDRPRIAYGAKERQIEDMRRLGLVADETVLQSEKFDEHYRLFLEAIKNGVIYPCFCSRKEIVDALASAPHHGNPPYTGACRDLKKWPEYKRPGLAWRFRHLEEDSHHDFIIARTDPPKSLTDIPSVESFVPSYQWACAIDDFQGNYTLLVRAWDLFDSAAQQRSIQKWLAKVSNTKEKYPAVFHSSLIVSNDKTRLEKRSRRVTLDEVNAEGFSDSEIVEKFRNSFKNKSTDFSPEKLFGEEKKELTLQELGFS